ncbi:hypothetical protein SBY92_001380 [Candida maltosa Xu316]|uniref:Smr domain-containing protein n=1 Tax=Candida maltosa (strain Xu316) TaxID=1245528 RepID=M3JED6_CANMX|nr:hypothetical protein G210_2199 [Candida maltosa Xu316]
MTDIINRGAKLFDDNETTERDYNHATDSEYKRLRNEADKLYKKKQQLSQQSQQAYKSGDKQQAHELSEESKRVLSQAEECNRQAAQYVFRENNEDSGPDEIDLHGLYVKEAEWILERRIYHAVNTQQSHLNVIVGKGLHSANGVAKIKPAVDELCDKVRLNHYIDPKNAGVLVIDLKNVNVNQLPSDWSQGLSNVSQPQQAYHGTGQPQYNQQPQHNNQYQQQPYNNNNNNNNNNGLVELVLKLVCACFNNK